MSVKISKSAYYKKMYELAIRMKVIKKQTEGSLIASFFDNAAEGFKKKWEEMKPTEQLMMCSEEEMNILKKYEEKVSALECELDA